MSVKDMGRAESCRVSSNNGIGLQPQIDFAVSLNTIMIDPIGERDFLIFYFFYFTVLQHLILFIFLLKNIKYKRNGR